MALHSGSSFNGLRLRDPATREALNEIADWIIALRQMRVSGAKFENSLSGIALAIEQVRGGSGSAPRILARVTAYNGTTRFYTAVGIEPTNTGDNTPGAGYADISPAVTYTGCFERRGFIGIEIGARVELVAAGTWAGSASVLAVGTALYSFQFVLPGHNFKVKVEKTGGAAGPISTWTYTVTSVDGHAIATAAAQELRRPASVATTFSPANTIGMGYWDAAKVFHLYDANETC